MKSDADFKSDREIEDAAAAWLGRRDAGLSAVEEREIQRWLDANPRHAAALRNVEAAWSALAKPSESGFVAEFESQLQTVSRRRKRRQAAASAAILAGVLGLAFAIWKPLPVPPQAAESNVVVRMPVQRKLPDGSVVDLKGDARIVVDFSSSVRRVSLTHGEAHFAVTKNPERPFIVMAGNVEVRAVGTAFSVQLGSTAVEVLVTDGRVAVDKPSGPFPQPMHTAPEPLATVDAGRRVIFELEALTAVAEVQSVPEAELRERLAWRSVRLEFTRTTLPEAVALLNQHAPEPAARLVIDDATLATMRVNGVFRADNSEAFVVLLENAFGIEAERSARTVKLRRISPAREK